MRYRAFFSYARADDKLANWLHRKLDSYRTPKALIGQDGALGPVPAKLHPIFRDRTDLEAGGHIDQVLQQALEDSECLVVLCTPTSAKSHWVNHECETFLKLGREARIFPVIGAGEPNSGDPETECFPPVLRGKGLLAADLREIKKPNAQLVGDGRDGGRLKLIAGLLGLPLDRLVQRERSRQRLLIGALSAAALVFAAVASAAVFQTIAASQNERRALAGEADANRQRDLAESSAAAERSARLAEQQQRKIAGGLTKLNDSQLKATNNTVRLFAAMLITGNIQGGSALEQFTLFEGFNTGEECPDNMADCLSVLPISIKSIDWTQDGLMPPVCSDFEGTERSLTIAVCRNRPWTNYTKADDVEFGFAIDEPVGLAVAQGRSLSFCGADSQCYFPTEVWTRRADGKFRQVTLPAGTRDHFDDVAVFLRDGRMNIIGSRHTRSGTYETRRTMVRWELDGERQNAIQIVKIVVRSSSYLDSEPTEWERLPGKLISVLLCGSELTAEEKTICNIAF